ncbi:LPS export ABC transporter permease LptF [Mesorhizobium sp. LHD-90]|uniref:LPS export ABC transporter permease LptF n=1 Tax=Mesorhizobium sp. LHD-90 TaxID=3071414 RepID=UPI0027DFCEE4|nr:LPS export ABC transporter permease LptF [Mesorhizobium sp. LHD-90]MDQ6435084.1 LPS export ABC transporter permease LptF [Mesorhizobium sp. LHD-90]
MNVIERYIFTKGLLTFIATLSGTMAIVWVTQVLPRLDLVTSNGQSAGNFMYLASLILPSVVPEVLPFSIAITVAQIFASMNTDSELAVINASGASRWTVVKPILVLATIASLASFLFANVIDPLSKLEFRRLLASARADLISLVVQEGSFRQVEKGLYIQIGERLPGGDLSSVFLADSREEGVDFIYYAKRGSVVEEGDDRTLVMNDGMVQRKSRNGDVSVIRFDSYAFDLSALASKSEGSKMYAKDRNLLYLFDPDPNDPMFQQKPQEFRAHLHRRLAEWPYSIVFALIGLAVAADAKSHREGRIHPLVTTLTLALFVRWLGFFIGNQAQSSVLFIPLIYAVPIAASAICIWFIATNRSMELPVTWAESLTAWSRRIGDRMAFLRIRGGTEPGQGSAP